MQMSYTKQAENAIRYAAKIVKEMNHPYIGTEHLLLGLRDEYSGVAGQILAQNGVEEGSVLRLMDELIAPREDVFAGRRPEESPRYRYILENSVREAHRLHASEIGTEHLLLSIIKDVDCVAARILITLNINLQKIFQDIMSAVGGGSEGISGGNPGRAPGSRFCNRTVLHGSDGQGRRGETGSGNRQGAGDAPSYAGAEQTDKE